MFDPACTAPAARGISKRCNCIGGTAGALQASNYGMTQTQNSGGVQPSFVGSDAAQHYNTHGKEIKVHDARGVEFEPLTSYVDHYPEKVALSVTISSPCLSGPACSTWVFALGHELSMTVTKGVSINCYSISAIGTEENNAWCRKKHCTVGIPSCKQAFSYPEYSGHRFSAVNATWVLIYLQALPEHTAQSEVPITGVPFTASTEYDNQYFPKSLTYNHIGTNSIPAQGHSSKSFTHKLPMITSETTNQHDYPYWGGSSPQKKGYAVRRVSAAPPLDFVGDTFTTTNAVEYQAKPLSYVPPTGTLYIRPW